MGGTPITWEIIVAIIVVAGFVATAWYRIQAHINAIRKEAAADLRNAVRDREVKVQAAHAEASLAIQQVAELRTHVAENYISKSGFKESMESITGTLHTINANLTHLNERIDRVIEGQSRQERRGSNA